MGTDLRKLAAELKPKRKKPDKKRVSMYFTASVYDDFLKHCKMAGISASKVVEHWMREQLADAKGKK